MRRLTEPQASGASRNETNRTKLNRRRKRRVESRKLRGESSCVRQKHRRQVGASQREWRTSSLIESLEFARDCLVATAPNTTAHCCTVQSLRQLASCHRNLYIGRPTNGRLATKNARRRLLSFGLNMNLLSSWRRLGVAACSMRTLMRFTHSLRLRVY